MKTALLYPFKLLIFWYHDICLGAVDLFTRFNSYLLRMFSVPLLLRTFFKPLKNEYRKGLVLFSIVFGIFLKGFLIITSLAIVLPFLIAELFIAAFLFSLPVLLIYLIYAGPNII